jgi:hypothetical protein
MGIRSYRPYTPGTRERTVSEFAEITRSEPEKSLTRSTHRPKGRNNRGVITCRHRGGGHKRLYRSSIFIAIRPEYWLRLLLLNTTPTAMLEFPCFITKTARNAIFFVPRG